MPEITTTPFKSWHMKLFKEGQHYEKVNLDPDLRSYLYRNIEGVTVLIDGEIAAIMGVALLWPGVGEVTMIPSDLFYKNLKHCVKLVRGCIVLAAETFNLHRIQGTTLASSPKHGRFLEFMGLQKEGVLRSYGPKGEDHVMYAYVRAV